ncbi:MAG: hypothetical protein AAGJ34_08855 [Pseudomonadota bacterium]
MDNASDNVENYEPARFLDWLALGASVFLVSASALSLFAAYGDHQGGKTTDALFSNGVSYFEKTVAEGN